MTDVEEKNDLTESDFKVELPHYCGFEPGKWLIILFILGFLFVAFVPSLFHCGRRLYVTSNREGFLLNINGVPIGTTPTNIYLKPGKYDIELTYNNKSIVKEKLSIKQSLFFSWLFEGKKNIKLNVQKLDDDVIFDIHKDFLEDTVQYSLIFKDSKTYPTKPIFSLYHSLLGNQMDSEVFKAGLKISTNPSILNDAKKVFPNEEIKGYIIPKYFKSETYTKVFQKNSGEPILSNGTALSHPVSQDEFAEFLKENETAKTEFLDRNYIMPKGSRPVCNVSVNLAKKYCEWKSKKLKKEVKLPTIWDIATLDDDATYPLLEITDEPFDINYILGNSNEKTDFGIFREYSVELPLIVVNGSDIQNTFGSNDQNKLTVLGPKSSSDKIGFRICVK